MTWVRSRRTYIRAPPSKLEEPSLCVASRPYTRVQAACDGAVKHICEVCAQRLPRGADAGGVPVERTTGVWWW